MHDCDEVLKGLLLMTGSCEFEVAGRLQPAGGPLRRISCAGTDDSFLSGKAVSACFRNLEEVKAFFPWRCCSRRRVLNGNGVPFYWVSLCLHGLSHMQRRPNLE